MRTSCKHVLALCSLVVGLAVSGACAAASGVGPYYAMPAWDQTLPAATRFIVLTNMNSDAVLDRETGLVWEKVPSTTSFVWTSASGHCVELSKGGRKGWRLPTIQELASLIDPTQVNPALPSGHPFTVQSSIYWSATTFALVAAGAWRVLFNFGRVDGGFKSDSFLAWCVRGGPGVDPQ